ncbi:MAG: carboxymuconolactone decarboxylase family protein [Alphaproteobacteria bacterium]
MPRLQPVRLEDVEDAELRDLIRQVDAAGVPGGTFARILALDPRSAAPTLRVLLESFTTGDIDIRLKELLRLQNAQQVDEPCSLAVRSTLAKKAGVTEAMIEAALGDYEEADFPEAWKVAMRFTEQMYLDSTKVDRAMYDELRKHFSEAQIMQIGPFISFCQGVHLFMRTFNATAADAA